MPVSPKLLHHQESAERRRAAVRIRRQADRDRWDIAARQCGQRLHEGAPSVVHQPGVPVGYYLADREDQRIRERECQPFDAETTLRYLREEARRRERDERPVSRA